MKDYIYHLGQGQLVKEIISTLNSNQETVISRLMAREDAIFQLLFDQAKEKYQLENKTSTKMEKLLESAEVSKLLNMRQSSKVLIRYVCQKNSNILWQNLFTP